MPTFPTYSGELPNVLNPLNLRHHGLLIYWIFFRPTALRCYLYQVDPELSETIGFLNFRRSFSTPAYRGLYLTALLLSVSLIILISLPLTLTINYDSIPLNPRICADKEFWGGIFLQDDCKNSQKVFQYPTDWMYWQKWLLGFLSRVLLLAIGVVIVGYWNIAISSFSNSIVSSVLHGVTFSVAFSVVSVGFGITSGVVSSITFVTVFSAAIGVAYSVAFNPISKLALIFLIDITLGSVFSFVFSPLFGFVFGFACLLGTLRLPFYLWQWLGWQSRYHPLGWDELLPSRSKSIEKDIITKKGRKK
jgi:hypothetical protein